MTSDVVNFGGSLKAMRRQRGLTQSQFVARLGSVVARSTIANVEAGRERPSERLWAAISEVFPEMADHLEQVYASARSSPTSDSPLNHTASRRSRSLKSLTLGGAFEIERLDIVYVFRESRAPEEILEIRTLRSLSAGQDEFRLKMKHSSSTGFESTPEVLWGGELIDEVRSGAHGQTVYLRTVQFGRSLGRGEQHVFALRSWVERDPDPDTSVTVTLSLAAKLVGIHLNFSGPKPCAVWSFGPIADATLEPRAVDAPGASPVRLAPNGVTSVVFPDPHVGVDYGVAWSWT